MSYFNPRSPYGERQIDLLFFFSIKLISIHAPHTGSDAFLLSLPRG